MEHPRTLQLAIHTIEEPVRRFIETGLFDERTWAYTDPKAAALRCDVSNVQVRRIARAVAKELNRPFIVASEIVNRDGQWIAAEIQMPKRKYLMPLVSPLLLASEAKAGPVYCRHKSTLWSFRINDQTLWNEYRAALDRPEMRAARKLPPNPGR